MTITFFACPKPFQGHIGIIQRNAIESWTRLKPRPEIILLGTDQGVAEICKELGLIHIPGVDKNEYGTPLVSSVFQIGQARASHSVVCYINSDIMLMNDFVQAIDTVVGKMPRFLVLGQRTDIDINEAWNFDVLDWESGLKSLLAQKGTLHAPCGIDFFCFLRGMYTDVPPLAIGRMKWDNWLVWRARVQGVPIVDVTEALVVIHQNHGYDANKIRKLSAGEVDSTKSTNDSTIVKFDGHWVQIGPEAQRNIALVPDTLNLNIWAATWMIDRKGRLQRRRLILTPAYLYYQIKWVVPLYWPAFGRFFRWMLAIRRTLLTNLKRKMAT